MLSAVGLTYVRNDNLLWEDLSFTVERGQALWVSGKNGVGKTTLLKTLAGLFKPHSGEVFWDRKPQDLLYIGHPSGLLPMLTPKENLQWMMSLKKTERMNFQKTEKDPLEFTKLQARIPSILSPYLFDQVPCSRLSSGQQARVNLLRLFFSEHTIWLLDEPFVHLDAEAQNILLDFLKEHLKQNKILVMVNHFSETGFSGNPALLESLNAKQLVLQ